MVNFTMKTTPSKYTIPKRYIIIFMIFMGYSNITILHTGLSMAVVDMTTVKNISTGENVFQFKAEFNWTSEQKGLILASYSYGRLFCLIGGILAIKIGGSTICSIGNLGMAIITLLSPIMLSFDFTLFFVVYILLGAFESLLMAGVPEIIAHWAPPNERCRFVSFGEVGFFFGSVASFIISGVLLKMCNWQMLFYCSGIVFFVWFWIWLIVVKNDPAEDKYMSESEQKYIRVMLNHVDEGKPIIPWVKIATFVPLWIGSLTEFSLICGLVFTSTLLPQYIKDTTNIDIESNGFISTIPQICSLISMPCCGCFADYIRSLGKYSIINVHRLFASISLFSSALCYALLAISLNFWVDIAAISLYQFCSTLLLIDVVVLFLDISPKYTAVFISIVNTWAICSGFVVPLIVESIVTFHSLSQWNICFMIFSGLYFCVALLYLKFISVEKPTWATVQPMPNQSAEMSNSIPP